MSCTHTMQYPCPRCVAQSAPHYGLTVRDVQHQYYNNPQPGPNYQYLYNEACKRISELEAELSELKMTPEQRALKRDRERTQEIAQPR